MNKHEYMKNYKKMMSPWDKCYYRIRQRCMDKGCGNYKNYGGRGIKCRITKKEIKNIWIRDNAYEMKRPSIDRIDIDGHYEYGNCRFIELSENAKVRRNTRKTFCKNGHRLSGNNLYVTYRGHRTCKKCRRIFDRRMAVKKFLESLKEGNP